MTIVKNMKNDSNLKRMSINKKFKSCRLNINHKEIKQKQNMKISESNLKRLNSLCWDKLVTSLKKKLCSKRN